MNVNYLNNISKIFLVLIFYMLISAIFFPILCQNKNIALVSNLNYKGKINRNSLDQLTLSLNKEDAKNVALIISNLSNSSSINCLNEIETIFADLKMPFKIISGHLNSIEDDHSLSSLRSMVVSNTSGSVRRV